MTCSILTYAQGNALTTSSHPRDVDTTDNAASKQPTSAERCCATSKNLRHTSIRHIHPSPR